LACRRGKVVRRRAEIMEWIDTQLKAEPQLAQEVEAIMGGMRPVQDLATLLKNRRLRRARSRW
jgi:hypothetical protein